MIGNISSTASSPRHPGWRLVGRRVTGLRASGLNFPALRWSTFLLYATFALALAWGAWATQRIVALSQARIVTVRLAEIMGEFVEAEARKGTDPETARRQVTAYLAAVGQAVDELGKNGTTVLVAEAVVAGPARDVTQDLRADVARRLVYSAKSDAD